MSLFRTLRSTVFLTISALPLACGANAAEVALPLDVQQRLEVLKTGFESYVLKSVTSPHEEAVKALNAKVTPALERESAIAAKRRDLDALVRIKADIERTNKGLLLTDADSPPFDSLKNVYAAYKLELAKIESAKKSSLANAKQLYDKGLMQIQDELTAAQKVEGALHVKQLREGLTNASLDSFPIGTAAVPVIKDGAYINSLGMKFVPVDHDGKTLLFSAWATRHEDYAAYAQEVQDLDKNWASTPANETVDQISWHEASSFCEWLTKKERKEKLINSSQFYRLPTGIEWSAGEGVFDEKLRSNWEWCQDVSGKDANGDELRVIRGKGRAGGAHHMGRYKNMGFRMILEGLSLPAKITAKPKG